MLSITSEGMAVAAQNYTLICTATRQLALSVTPEVQWLDSAGNQLDSEEGITITVLTTGNETVAELDFNPLKTSNGGQYTCRAILESNAALAPLNKTATVSVVVQCKFSTLSGVKHLRHYSGSINYSTFCSTSLAPQPAVTMTASPNVTIYSGSILLLTCTAQIRAEIDTAVAVTITWRKSGTLLANQGRTAIVSATQIRAFFYQSTAEFSPVSQQLDSGMYTCEVIVTPSPPSSFVTSATTLSSLSVTVHGESIILQSYSAERLWIRLMLT